MNLENLNVTELNAHEMQNTEGGIIPLIIIGAAALLSGCAAAKPLFFQTDPEDSCPQLNNPCEN